MINAWSSDRKNRRVFYDKPVITLEMETEAYHWAKLFAEKVLLKCTDEVWEIEYIIFPESISTVNQQELETYLKLKINEGLPRLTTGPLLIFFDYYVAVRRKFVTLEHIAVRKVFLIISEF
jgi:hypothetical protein